MSFTAEEIKAAQATRDTIIRDNISVLKSIYMAGEICMWAELNEPPDERELLNDVTVGDIIKIRNYFGEHDLSPFEHRAYIVMDRLVDFFIPRPAPPQQ